MKDVLTLTSEGYSYHTLELNWNPTNTQFEKTYQYFQNISKHHEFYSLKQYQNTCTFCGALTAHGIRIYLTKTKHKNVVKLIVNPRRLIDTNASYLGIMPPDSDALERLEEEFTDCMRKVHLPEFLEEWKLTRLDLCVNVLWNKKKGPHELIRLIRKWPAPAGYVKDDFDGTDAGKHRRGVKNTHIVKYSNDSLALVIYDKVYQIKKEKLAREGEQIPKGILRIELQCKKPWLKAYGKERHITDPRDLIASLAWDSRDLICRYAETLCRGGTHYKLDAMEEELYREKWIRKKTRKRMLRIAECLRDSKRAEQALEEIELSEKQLRTCLKHFKRLDIHPVALRDDYPLDRVPSLPALLQELEEDDTKLRFRSQAKRCPQNLYDFSAVCMI